MVILSTHALSKEEIMWASHRLQFSFNPMIEYRSLILFIYLFSNPFVIHDNFSCSYRSEIFIKEYG